MSFLAIPRIPDSSNSFKAYFKTKKRDRKISFFLLKIKPEYPQRERRHCEQRCGEV